MIGLGEEGACLCACERERVGRRKKKKKQSRYLTEQTGVSGVCGDVVDDRKRKFSLR